MVPLSGSRKLFIRYRSFDSLCEEPRSLIYSAFVSVSKSRMFALGLGFSIKSLGVSRQVSDFPIRHPLPMNCLKALLNCILDSLTYRCLTHLLLPGD